MIPFLRHLPVFTVLALLPLSNLHAQTGSDLKLEDLLQRYYAANGGLDNILSIRSLRAEGEIRRSSGEEGSLILLKKRPNRQLTSIRMKDDRVIIRGNDGETSWVALEQPGLPTYVETVAEAGDTRFDSFLVTPDEDGLSLRLLEPTREGRDLLYPVEVLSNDGRITIVYLEARTMREVRRVEKWEQDGEVRERVVDLSQHSKVNNVWFAKRQVSRLGNDETIVEFQTITLNPGIFDDAFNAPRD